MLTSIFPFPTPKSEENETPQAFYGKILFVSKTTAFSDNSKPSRIVTILRAGEKFKVNQK